VTDQLLEWCEELATHDVLLRSRAVRHRVLLSLRNGHLIGIVPPARVSRL
jgi:hypothetical protein